MKTISLLINRQLAPSARRLVLLLPAFFLVSVSSPATAENTGGSAIAPQSMVDVKSPDAEKQMKPDQGGPAIKVDKSGVSVSFPGGPAEYPGFFIKPASGDSWDLSPFGHIETRVTNTGDKPISVSMRVDGAEGYKEASTETVSVKPGETKDLKVIFGYQYGYKPGPAVNPSKITELLVFLNKSADPRSFRLEDIQGAGSAGEKPTPSPRLRPLPGWCATCLCRNAPGVDGENARRRAPSPATEK